MEQINDLVLYNNYAGVGACSSPHPTPGPLNSLKNRSIIKFADDFVPS
jgi:hypothetical protein